MKTNLTSIIVIIIITSLVLLGCEPLNSNPIEEDKMENTNSSEPAGTKSETTSIIGAILSAPARYQGKEVSITGYFQGWNLLGEATGKSPKTRSDWVVKDNSGAIYVSAYEALPEGLNPGSKEDTNKIVAITGVVQLTADNQPYIEPSSVVLVDQQMSASPSGEVELASNPFPSKPGDDELTQGKAYIDSIEIKNQTATSATLLFKGSLPTPCNELRLGFTSAGNELAFTAFSVVAKGMICTEVIQPIEFELELSNLDAVDYIVKVNDQEMANLNN